MKAPLCALALLAWHSLNAHAATYRIDDSASIPRDSTVAMTWSGSERHTRRATSQLEGQFSVLLRLDTSPFVQRSGRLYLVLDDAGIGPVKARWTTLGRLQSGVVQAGQRTLVYSGTIAERQIEDRLVLTVQTDAAHYSGLRQLNFRFEIDLD